MPFELHNKALNGDGLKHVCIACRPNLANGELNGSTGYVVAQGEETVRVWLTSGPRAGLCWSFGVEDIAGAFSSPASENH